MATTYRHKNGDVHIHGNYNTIINANDSSIVKTGRLPVPCTPLSDISNQPIATKSVLYTKRESNFNPIRVLVVGAIAVMDLIIKTLQGCEDGESTKVQETNNCKHIEIKGINFASITFPRTLTGKVADTSQAITVSHILKPGPNMVIFPIMLDQAFDSEVAKRIKSDFKNMRIALGDVVTKNHTYILFITESEDASTDYIERFPDLKAVVKTYCHDHTLNICDGTLIKQIHSIVKKQESDGCLFYGDGIFKTMMDVTQQNPEYQENSGEPVKGYDENDVKQTDPEHTPSIHRFKPLKKGRGISKRKKLQKQIPTPLTFLDTK